MAYAIYTLAYGSFMINVVGRCGKLALKYGTLDEKVSAFEAEPRQLEPNVALAPPFPEHWSRPSSRRLSLATCQRLPRLRLFASPGRVLAIMGCFCGAFVFTSLVNASAFLRLSHDYGLLLLRIVSDAVRCDEANARHLMLAPLSCSHCPSQPPILSRSRLPLENSQQAPPNQAPESSSCHPRRRVAGSD